MAIGENEGRATIIGEGIGLGLAIVERACHRLGLGLVTDFDFGCVLFEPR